MKKVKDVAMDQVQNTKSAFQEKLNNYILVSVSTRFIRDWIVSRYLDQILNTIKKFNKEIINY